MQNAAIQDRIDHMETFFGHHAGLMIYDPYSGETLYAHNPDRYFVPASNVKLLTTLAAITMLPERVPDYWYYYKSDSLILWPYGNPVPLNPKFTAQESFNFLRNRKGNVYLVHRSVTEKALGPGWAWGDYSYAYSAERSAFPLYGNLFQVYRDSIDQAIKASPGFFQHHLIADTLFSSAFLRAFTTDSLRINPGLIQWGAPINIPYTTSMEKSALLLSDTLGKPVTIIADSGIRDWYPTRGHHLDSLLKPMLKDSDNFLAEQILIMASAALGDTLNQEKAIKHTTRRFFAGNPRKIVWVDGSGLSRYNLVTPEHMVHTVDLLLKLLGEDRLLYLLPNGGVDGTLKDRFTGTDPFIFAKTGTLWHHHNLSGLIRTRKGRLLVFSFMNNNYEAGAGEVRPFMDALLREFAENN